MDALDIDSILAFLLEQSLLLLVLAGLLYVIFKWAKGMDVRLRYGIGLMVLFKSVLFPIIYLPMLPTTWLGFSLPDSREFSSLTAKPSTSSTSLMELNTSPVWSSQSNTVQGMQGTFDVPAADPSFWSWSEIVFSTWAVGFVIYMLLVLSHAWSVRRHLLAHRSDPDLAIECEFVEVFHSLGLKRRPRLCMIEGIEQPFVWGLNRGMVYLPHRFADIGSTEHRRFVLAHELGHVVRCDAFFNLCQMFIQGIYWFHPAVWWLNAKVRQEREKCCDEFALAATQATAKDYATAVVDHLVYNGHQSYGLSALAMSGNARNLEDRINSMLHPGKQHGGHLSRIGLLQIALMAALLLPFHPTTSQAARKTGETTSFKHLDLSGLPNVNATDLDLHFADLPKGKHQIEQIPYSIHSVSYPTINDGDFVAGSKSEKMTGAISVNGHFSNLYLFHGVRGTAGKGDVIAKCVLHYNDSSSVEVPIQYGVHLQDWMFWEYEPVGDPRSKMAWVGSNEAARLLQAGLRLYHSPLSNPFPDRKVVSMDYQTSQEECEPFLLGMTIDFRE